MTNADRIRAMTDEELAKIMNNDKICPHDDCPVTECEDCWLAWLKSEVDENARD